MKRYFAILGLLALVVVASYGCSSAGQSGEGPTAVTGSQADVATATQAPSTATATAVVADAGATGTPWVPPTALVGTPLPGAEATLTAAPQLKKGTLSFTNSKGEQVNMTVEIADDEPSRELGLMFRSSMPPDAGMLFDFGTDTTGGFWMANTILPLSIAFVDASGKIIDIRDMQPLDRTGIGPSGPYRYAIEANQGYYRAHDIVVGNQMTIGPGQQSAVIPGMPGCGQ